MSKEVAMSRKNLLAALLAVIVAGLLFSTTGCEKLNINRLKANHHFSNANSLFTDQKYRLAIEEYEQALHYNPDLVQAYRFLGESYKSLYKPGVDNEENNERAQRALDALTKALEIEPNNKQIIHSLGDMYDKMRNFEEAEKLFLRILDMEPTNMSNYYVVAGFYKRYAAENEELKSRAEKMYLRRIETDPENPEGYAYLAQFYDEQTPMPEFDKAYEAHMIRTELEPKNNLVWYTLGVNRFQKAYRLQNVLPRAEREKIASEAEEALLKALELDNTHSFTYAYLNMLYRNIHAKLYPGMEKSYIERADTWMERFREVRKRELEREKLERELERGEIR
jgi:tetratricopeptide (TPR) repeat protein